jgi:hypothetical protein
MALTIRDIETAAFYMKVQLQKESDVAVEATYAPDVSGMSSSDIKYYSFIALTQRILYKGEVVMYLTYRSTQTSGGKHPQLSSYEVFDRAYRRPSGVKFKLKDMASPEEAFKETFNFIVNYIKSLR